jgi:hypothetical protein
MREILTDTATELPPRMPAPMSKQDIWATIEGLTRLLGEANRRGLSQELYGKLDTARLIALGLYAAADLEPGHSVQVVS